MIFLGVIATLVTRLLPVFQSPLSTYGYDYGFYLHAYKNAALSWQTLIPAYTGGFDNLLFHLFRPLPVLPEVMLSSLHFAAALLLPLALYYYYSQTNKLAGVAAALLAALSIVQTEAYLMFLLKTLLALPLLIISFKFLERKQYPALVITAAALLTLHRTTALIFGLCLATYWIYARFQKRRLAEAGLMLIGAAAAIALVFVAFDNRILYLLSNPSVTTGLFLEDQELWSVFWPIAVLGVLGIAWQTKKNELNLFTILTLLSLIWIALELPFYRRMFIYLDLGLVASAAYLLGSLRLTRKTLVAVALVFLFLVYRQVDFIQNRLPLISAAETTEIKNFSNRGAVLALSAVDAPWLWGFLPVTDQRVFAPGFFGDPHSYQDWLDFWAEKKEIDFFQTYPRPLFLYQRSFRIPEKFDPCLEPVSANFSELTCQ